MVMTIMNMIIFNKILMDLLGWPYDSFDCLLFVRQLGPVEDYVVKEKQFWMQFEL